MEVWGYDCFFELLSVSTSRTAQMNSAEVDLKTIVSV
jgi:hypothetical protein